MLFLSQLASDNFFRTNESPLSSPPWSVASNAIQPGLQIVSHICQGSAINVDSVELYTGVSLPNDQYASATLAAGITGNANVAMGIRTTDNGSSENNMPGYFVRVTGNSNGGLWQVFNPGSLILSGSGLTVSSGDVFTFAAIGVTIYFFQNGVMLGSVTDTGHSSGSAMLVAALGSTLNAVQYSNFACGKASLTPGGTGTGYSVPDCRVSPAGPNSSRVVQGTVIYDVPKADSRAAGAPVDSRAAGAPVDSRVSSNVPLNSRTPGTFGPGE
jgi:hypothetical protein